MLPIMNSILTQTDDFVGAGSAEVPWPEALRKAVREVEVLAEVLRLPQAWIDQARRAARQFPLLVPWEFVRRIRPADPHDPLLRQVLPIGDELIPEPGYSSDPLGELQRCRAPGLLQKYAGRALIVTTGACAIHCRYCFRRHFPYHDLAAARRHWPVILEELASDASIDEVILSGGDPLVLPDAWLREWVEALGRIPHLARLRLHTRLPVVIPQRVTQELIDWLRGTRLTPLVVVHVNHPQELDETCCTALTKLVDSGIPVLNQAVLLRGVNDSADVLEELCRRLANLRVLPYYLHQLDPVQGAHHFAVPVQVGIEIVSRLRERLPGYAVPRLVVEEPGQPAKRLLAG
ncbi:MAG: EF-P beta-lysylation protein EpmB [Pirellulaceae bacterium]|nr:MAG: EF-P beta-lysylation protein EpmB [Pirellulaceae bacterium]